MGHRVDQVSTIEMFSASAQGVAVLRPVSEDWGSSLRFDEGKGLLESFRIRGSEQQLAFLSVQDSRKSGDSVKMGAIIRGAKQEEEAGEFAIF